VDPAEVVGLEVVNEEEDQRMLQLLRQQVCGWRRLREAWVESSCLAPECDIGGHSTVACKQLHYSAVQCSRQLLVMAQRLSAARQADPAASIFSSHILVQAATPCLSW
jgi:hypothetical protein